MSNLIRIKINICYNKSASLIDESKFWYCLNPVKITKIGELENELRNILIEKFNIKNDYFHNKQLRFYVDEFLLPYWEESTILRDNDLLKVTCDINRKRSLDDEVNEENTKKRKLNSQQEDHKKVWSLTNIVYNPLTTYDLCIFGTSMVKHVRIESFENSKTGIHKIFLKSISGGKIIDIYNFIKARKFVNTKYFMITCGSNDCDSLFINDTQLNLKKIINDYTLLLDYLKTTYENAKIFINQLVPRLKTRYSLGDFERNRCKLNEYLEKLTQQNTDKYVFIKHPEFENLTKLRELLYDGVHIHPIYGVPVYVKEIRDVFDNNR